MKSNLCFESITYQNFMGTGSKAITILLNSDPTTLIYGKNGSGKSTMYEALYYCLYGKTFKKKATIPDLINNINNKRMLTKAVFTVQGVKFEVIRGRVPIIFEIYKEGKLVDQTSRSLDYQAYLEKTVLKMSPETFKQIAILGSLHYVPYMRIEKQKDRMAIIEELLDIQIFSMMNWLTRVRFNKNKKTLTDLDIKYNLLENSIKLVTNHINDMEAKTDEYKNQIRTEIETLKTSRDQLTAELVANAATVVTLDTSAKSGYIADREKWTDLRTLAEKELADLERDLEFFKTNSNCDRCHRDIDEEFKQNILLKTETRKAKVLKARTTKIQVGIDNALSGLAEMQIISDRLVKLNLRAINLSTSIGALTVQVEKLDASLQNGNDASHISGKRVELGHFKASLTKLLKKKAAIEIDSDEYDIVIKLLQDDGIKRNIIKMYIPVINKLISKYLSILGFPIKFVFDENFKEHIIVKGRRNLSYSSFSAGEQMRVNLAILFAFREIPIIRSGNSCNLLIFDEVADSAMDSEGWDSFLTIINAVSDIGNVFVISPKGEEITDKFIKSIRVKKIGAFSMLDSDAEV